MVRHASSVPLVLMRMYLTVCRARQALFHSSVQQIVRLVQADTFLLRMHRPASRARLARTPRLIHPFVQHALLGSFRQTCPRRARHVFLAAIHGQIRPHAACALLVRTQRTATLRLALRALQARLPKRDR